MLYLEITAIDLVDEAAAALKMIITSKPAAIHAIESLIKSEEEKLSLEDEEVNASGQRLDLDHIRKRISDLTKEKDEVTGKWNCGKFLITRIHVIKKLVSNYTLLFFQIKFHGHP